MKTAVLFVLLALMSQPGLAEEKYLMLSTTERKYRTDLNKIDPQKLLAKENVLRVIVLPTLKWRMSGISPSQYIAPYKATFLAARKLESVPEKAAVNTPRPQDGIPFAEIFLPLDYEDEAYNWSDIYFILKNGDFITFGRDASRQDDSEWMVFRTRSVFGRFKEQKDDR